jgi:anaerobic magnesium-protoporphyrin IX monomethyl ester cyclase
MKDDIEASRCDLVVIHPGAAHGIYGKLGDQLTALEPPMWARVIAGYARDAGFAVRIIDAEAEGMTPLEAAVAAWSYNPRLVCLAVYGHQPSASTQQMTGARDIARALKDISPTKVIMVGGHVSALPERTLVEEPIDFACKGEGPVTVVALLEALPTRPAHYFDWEEKLASVPGLVYWLNARPVVNAPAPLLDIDALCGDVWDDLPMKKYRAHNWQALGWPRQPYASIFTSLGCPYRCSFCCINAPFDSRRYRTRDPKKVVEEIVYLHRRHGVRTFKIVDEMFVLNEAHYTEVARGILAADIGRDISIWAYARVDTVKPGTLRLLREAGFRWLALGIESASAYVRDGAQKRLRNDDIRQVVKTIEDADINVIGNYIFGLPDDDRASMQATLDLAVDLNTAFANFYVAMAYPGSPLYDEAVAKGKVLPETWRGYSQHNDACRPLDTDHVSAADVLAFRDCAFTTYFTGERYLRMVVDKFGPSAVEEIKKMTSYPLTRKLLERDRPAAVPPAISRVSDQSLTSSDSRAGG